MSRRKETASSLIKEGSQRKEIREKEENKVSGAREQAMNQCECLCGRRESERPAHGNGNALVECRYRSLH